MKILVVIPIQIEIDCFLQGFAEQGIRSESTRLGKLPVFNLTELGITIGKGGLGKTQFAIHTQHLIEAGSKWDLVICAGAAGALIDNLSIGDIVIATETVEHDIHNKSGKPMIPRYAGSDKAIDILKEISLQHHLFTLHFGPVASGDEDVVDHVRRNEIQQLTGALAVAWEGAGGARAARFNNIPYLEMRCITDNANTTAIADFEVNLKKAMGNLAKLIIRFIKHYADKNLKYL